MADKRKLETLTMPYLVAFRTWTLPDPGRIGTAERIILSTRVWAHDADEAIAETKRLCAEANREYISTIEVSVPETGIARELILNDPESKVTLKDLDPTVNHK